MPSHYELRYWSNGIRRCDIYPEKQAKRARAALAELTIRRHPIPAQLALVVTSQNIEKEYREIRKGTVVGVFE